MGLACWVKISAHMAGGRYKGLVVRGLCVCPEGLPGPLCEASDRFPLPSI